MSQYFLGWVVLVEWIGCIVLVVWCWLCGIGCVMLVAVV